MTVHRSLSDIFKIPERKSNLVILVMSFATACFSFYLLGYNVKHFFGYVINNGIILGTADIIAALIGKVCLDTFTTKQMLISGYLISGLAGTVHLFSKSIDLLYAASILTMRIGVVIAYFFSYFANVEYFPSDFSTSVFGASNFVA